MYTATSTLPCTAFQFSPLREGRRTTPDAAPLTYTRFQFSPLREGRRECRSYYCYNPQISILAPARGATLLYMFSKYCRLFQFSPLREGRLSLLRTGISGMRFQFSPLREGRQACRRSAPSAQDFNSRPCERGDFADTIEKRCGGIISILAPARGATFIAEVFHRVQDFNSRPCERGDLAQYIVDRQAFHFNSRPCERGDARSARLWPQWSGNFNSRPCERGDGTTCPVPSR